MRGLKFRHYNLFTNEMEYSEKDFYNLEHYFSNRQYESSDEMQFTGLKDKNGVDVYGDDIVNHTGIGIGYIEYNEKHAAYKIVFKGTTRKWLIDMLEREIRDIEVIGNKCENPELLESK